MECVTDLTIISFDLSADTRESEELEPADTCLSTQINCSMCLHKRSSSEYMASLLSKDKV